MSKLSNMEIAIKIADILNENDIVSEKDIFKTVEEIRDDRAERKNNREELEKILNNISKLFKTDKVYCDGNFELGIRLKQNYTIEIEDAYVKL